MLTALIVMARKQPLERNECPSIFSTPAFGGSFFAGAFLGVSFFGVLAFLAGDFDFLAGDFLAGVSALAGRPRFSTFPPLPRLGVAALDFFGVFFGVFTRPL